mmetsp:Transcript_2156/g.5464  ORF Transcript_2156/g.5464 Transcript_2156/m.5464 type:complete len:508 (+) Transcript_2156:77-1600(+)
MATKAEKPAKEPAIHIEGVGENDDKRRKEDSKGSSPGSSPKRSPSSKSSFLGFLGCFSSQKPQQADAPTPPQSKEDDLMPFRKTNQRIEEAGLGTSSLASGRRQVLHGKAAEEYCTESTSFSRPLHDSFYAQSANSGIDVKDPLTLQNISQKCLVVRGPHWSWGQEDGGRGMVGEVLSWDTKTNCATVRWRTTGNTFSHYRLARSYDLCLAVLKAEASQPKPGKMLMAKRNSQGAFADPTQSIIIFDWDDTLFPTTYVRVEKSLKWHKPLQQQAIKPREQQMIAAKLGECARHVCTLLKMANEYGKVVLVTLAKNPWVTTSCKNFYPQVLQVIEQLQIPVIYAQEGVSVDYNKTSMMADEELELFWSGMKGKAITREVDKFYSQYEGQSWKNIISVGDSDFERLGTRRAIAEYMEDKGLDPLASRQMWQAEAGVTQMIKVRTKTFKLVDQPTVDELTTEVTLLEQWLPLMVTVDKTFDINLEDMEGPPHMWGIEEKLRNGAMALPRR